MRLWKRHLRGPGPASGARAGQAVARGEVVAGGRARRAVRRFADLGPTVVDEEDDPAYKQEGYGVAL